MASSSLKRGLMPMEEQLLLKEMHMKNSITITPSKPSNKSGTPVSIMKSLFISACILQNCFLRGRNFLSCRHQQFLRSASFKSQRFIRLRPFRQKRIPEKGVVNCDDLDDKNQSSMLEKKRAIEPVRLTPAWEGKNLPNDILNFKSVTMERANLETNPPEDRYLIVYSIVIIHGMGILMPWNMFITAKEYFEEYKLSPNHTSPDVDTSFYRTYFMASLCVFGTLPNVIFNWVNIFISLGGNLTSRIVYSIVLEVIIFLFTEVMVLVDSSGWPILFFWITMGSVFLLNVVNGIYSSTIYGIAARLPPNYTGGVIIGNNLSGIFAVLISIATKVFAPDLRTAASYYFIVALFVLFVCFDTYFVLPLTKFYKYHELQFEKAKEKKLIAAEETNVTVQVPYIEVLKACSLQCFNVFFVFIVTLTMFPAVQSAIITSNPGTFFTSDAYFVDVTCFLTFNVFATLGSLLSTFVTWPDPKHLHIAVLLRTIFIPLFLFCNYQVEGRSLPVLIDNDYIYWVIAMVFALTSGYFSSLAMMYCGKSVPPENSSVAGMFGAAFLVTGIFLGIVLAFCWPIFVKI